MTSRLLLIVPEISGKFPEILSFRKIYNPSDNVVEPGDIKNDRRYYRLEIGL